MLGSEAVDTLENEWLNKVEKKGWSAADVTKEPVTIQLSDEHLIIIIELMEKTKQKGLRLEDIKPHHFHEPLLEELMRSTRYALKEKIGFVIIRGLPVSTFSIDDIKRMYVGLSSYFGQPVSQSRFGDLVGENFVRAGDGRGGHRAGPLPLHNDPIEVLSLCCIRKAVSGGENTLVSSLKVWEIIEKTRPNYLPIFYRGFRVHLAGEQRPDQEDFTSEPVPIFSEKYGLRSCWMNVSSVELLAKARGDVMTDVEREAVRYLLSVIRSEELCISIQLEPGEMIYINNFEVMHSRLDFTESTDPENFRYLLRLWLQDTPSRPMIDQLNIHQNKSGLQGIDMQLD
ncbi:TauD/TfdA family dioxygenase [Glaciimonas immobilis]|uniref:TauD/TfdA-like domain-containing protein n=1 Tax=Glaciimonas immobilis TaxID=728004 RepID=A0A840RSC7_9BURK|nr:TauD/TfdA family dioxygenase [Glaciimonas immobilis]KAF3997028.1 TauD/TfdA family dioxygenase [Glaciimonas immobilis]MBB5199866.1 hypothetical protein [Glaciimonas immobilis]